MELLRDALHSAPIMILMVPNRSNPLSLSIMAASLSSEQLTSTPSISPLAKPIFESPDADLILRSADNVAFRTFQSFLIFGSPVLKTLIQQQLQADLTRNGTQEGDLRDYTPVLQLVEDSQTIEHLLLYSYPRWMPPPVLDNLQVVKNLLAAVKKYKMDGLLEVVRKSLKSSPLMKTAPRQLFAIAYRHHLDEVARQAVMEILCLPSFHPTMEADVDGVSAGVLYRLHSHHTEIRAAVIALTTSYTRWITQNHFTWFSCPGCCEDMDRLVCRRIICGRLVKVGQWWIDYMADIATALTASPHTKINLGPELIKKASDAAQNCRFCQKRAIPDMRQVDKLFTTAVKRLLGQASIA